MAASRWPRLFCIFWILVYIPKSQQLFKDLQQTYDRWALHFGDKLVGVSTTATNIRFLEAKFQEDKAYVNFKDGARMVSQFATDLDKMLQEKVEAVERLVEIAENAHMEYVAPAKLEVNYYNAKQLNAPIQVEAKKGAKPEKPKLKNEFHELVLEEHEHFNNIPVNTSISTVHIPTSVFNEAPAVLQGIDWSDKLDHMFRSNYERDPTLTWQYFGSSTGFFRNFPGTKWQVEEDGLDLFDCRTRGWYIQAAASPKDMVIAIDISGSMTGLRIEIAKQTVNNILDSLGDDDFVNVFMFNESIYYVEPCFNQTMVQANLDNKQRLRDTLDGINKQTEGFAEYDVALTEAFELLARMNHSEEGAQCNQAIMLITDGSPLHYEEVFKKYNWPEPHVRIFSYLIGREVTQKKEVQWMSCTNKGYFAHVSTLADVQEHVVKYIYVMSRPMVLAQNHTTIWTGTYLDLMDPKSEHWLYEVEKMKNLTEHKAAKTLRLMTSVAQPVFDMRNDSRNNGNLLGVMGTDIPLKELMKYTPPYRLGVNCYAFAVTNNGYILFHPDLRPMYNNLPKPNYNSVDIVEVELDNDEASNPFTLNSQKPNSRIYVLRTKMVDRLTDSLTMTVKMHYDDMNRVYVRKQKYFFTPILKTPFTLGLAFSVDSGFFEVLGRKPVNEIAIDREFTGLNWKIHPNWVYCRLTNEEAKMDRRDMIKLYIGRGQNNSDLYNNCDLELMEYLAFDARATVEIPPLWDKMKAENEEHGIRSLFLSTRSGLTRYVEVQDLEIEAILESENITEKSFLDHHDTSIDEVFYKRAAEHGNGTFVFSVPFDPRKEYNASGNVSLESLTLVTGSSAVVVQTSGRRGVAGVVGLQFRYDKFKELIWAASKDKDTGCAPSEDCGCSRDEVICYLLDDHGYIIATSDFNEVGKFIGQFHSDVMFKLELLGVYKAVELYDYQGMCPKYKPKSNQARVLFNPFYNLLDIIRWTWKHTIWVMLKLTLYSWWQDTYAGRICEPVIDSSKEPEMIPEDPGKPEDWYPCDLEFDRYLFNTESSILPHFSKDNINTDNCNKDFSVHKVPKTNLLLLIVDSLCNCDFSPMSLQQREVKYNSTTLCLRLTADIHRRRPPYCYAYHEDEKPDESCPSEASCIKLSPIFFLGLGIIFLHHQYHS